MTVKVAIAVASLDTFPKRFVNCGLGYPVRRRASGYRETALAGQLWVSSAGLGFGDRGGVCANGRF